jgi:hypothetical protein
MATADNVPTPMNAAWCRPRLLKEMRDVVASDDRSVKVLVFARVLTVTFAAVVSLHHSDPAAAFQRIRPGMTYQEVKAVLAQWHVAIPLARSFCTPIKQEWPELRGEPSFEKREWGRVDSDCLYEPDCARDWRVKNRVPLSKAARRKYTVRQWGVGNTASYTFIGVFDETDVLVCRSWGAPTESSFRRWSRWIFGLFEQRRR